MTPKTQVVISEYPDKKDGMIWLQVTINNSEHAVDIEKDLLKYAQELKDKYFPKKETVDTESKEDAPFSF